MSHFARLAAIVLSLASASGVSVACSSSQSSKAEAPEAEAPAEPAPLDPAAPADPAAVDPAAPEPAVVPTPVNDAPSITTLFVGDALAPCEGEGARKCLLVRGSEGEQWRNFYGSIEGFDYEPSYTYELRVEVTQLQNPPPDAASIHYRLVELKSKTKTGK